MHSTPQVIKLSENSRQPKSIEEKIHRVKRGDTLVKIAAQHRTTVKVLHELNPQIAELETLPHKYMLYVQPPQQRPTPASASAPAPASAFNPALWMAVGGLILAASAAFFLSRKSAKHEPKEPQLEERSGVLYKQTTASNKGGGRRILLNDGKRCGQAELLLNLAQERYAMGCSLQDYKKAAEEAEEGLKMASDVQDSRLEMVAHGLLSEIYESVEDFVVSMHHSGRALELAIEVGDAHVEMLANLSKGNALGRLGNLQSAISHQRAAMELAIELNDLDTEGRCYGALGASFQEVEQYQTASGYMEKSVQIFMHTGDLGGMLVAYANMGGLHSLLKDYRMALEYQAKALELAQRIGNRDMESRILISLQDSAREAGDKSMLDKYRKQYLEVAGDFSRP